MLKSTPLHLQNAYPDQIIDDALRQAFGTVLAEEMPLRLRAALEALCQIGPADDGSGPANSPSR